jgi:hypothetical protein
MERGLGENAERVVAWAGAPPPAPRARGPGSSRRPAAPAAATPSWASASWRARSASCSRRDMASRASPAAAAAARADASRWRRSPASRESDALASCGARRGAECRGAAPRNCNAWRCGSRRAPTCCCPLSPRAALKPCWVKPCAPKHCVAGGGPHLCSPLEVLHAPLQRAPPLRRRAALLLERGRRVLQSLLQPRALLRRLVGLAGALLLQLGPLFRQSLLGALEQPPGGLLPRACRGLRRRDALRRLGPHARQLPLVLRRERGTRNRPLLLLLLAVLLLPLPLLVLRLVLLLFPQLLRLTNVWWRRAPRASLGGRCARQAARCRRRCRRCAGRRRSRPGPPRARSGRRAACRAAGRGCRGAVARGPVGDALPLLPLIHLHTPRRRQLLLGLRVLVSAAAAAAFSTGSARSRSPASVALSAALAALRSAAGLAVGPAVA